MLEMYSKVKIKGQTIKQLSITYDHVGIISIKVILANNAIILIGNSEINSSDIKTADVVLNTNQFEKIEVRLGYGVIKALKF